MRELLDRVSHYGLELVKLTTSQAEKEESTRAIVVEIEPVILEDNDKEIVLSCKLSFGLDDSAFLEMVAEYKMVLVKKDEITGREVLEGFSAFEFPMMSEFGLLLAQVSKSMGSLPLLMSPNMLRGLAYPEEE